MGTPGIQQLQEAMYNLLNTQEQNELIEILNDYHARRMIQDFAYSLKALLDTPAKRQLATLLRRFITKKDAYIFDQLMNGYDTNSLPNRKSRRELENVGRAPSTQSMPTRYYQTTQPRGRKVIRRPGERPQGSKLNLPNWEAGIIGDKKRIVIDLNRHGSGQEGLGFSIRGGAEHGIGIYVSYVDVNSVAEKQGLVPGDQVLSVNGHAFQKISHTEAANIIKSSQRLEIDVRNVGRVPGSFETHQTYTWVDAAGRTVSPPPEVDRIGRYDPTGVRKSGLMLLKDSDERKVNVQVTDNRPLGLMIRGGNEFGLGIYITGIDPHSVAENAGLKVGDLILDLNGLSFLDISHSEAVRALKSSKHIMLTIKDVGKLPYARTTYDHTQWISGRQLSVKPSTPPVPSPVLSTKDKNEPIFLRGAGSQLMHTSFCGQQAQKGMLEEQARQLLNNEERTTLTYYLSEYEKEQVSVDALVMALFELLNTQSKFALMTEIRGLITAKDIERFDSKLLEREIQAIKQGHEMSSGVDGMSDTVSTASQASNTSQFEISSDVTAAQHWSITGTVHGAAGQLYLTDSTMYLPQGSVDSSDLFKPAQKPLPPLPRLQVYEDKMDPLQIAIDSISISSGIGENNYGQSLLRTVPSAQGNGTHNHQNLPHNRGHPPNKHGSPSNNHSNQSNRGNHGNLGSQNQGDFVDLSPRHTYSTISSAMEEPVHNSVTVAQVHPNPVLPSYGRGQMEDSMRSPSEDSGVEMNGSGNGHTENHSNHNRVTMSPQEPIVINDMLSPLGRRLDPQPDDGSDTMGNGYTRGYNQADNQRNSPNAHSFHQYESNKEKRTDVPAHSHHYLHRNGDHSPDTPQNRQRSQDVPGNSTATHTTNLSDRFNHSPSLNRQYQHSPNLRQNHRGDRFSDIPDYSHRDRSPNSRKDVRGNTDVYETIFDAKLTHSVHNNDNFANYNQSSPKLGKPNDVAHQYRGLQTARSLDQSENSEFNNKASSSGSAGNTRKPTSGVAGDSNHQLGSHYSVEYPSPKIHQRQPIKRNQTPAATSGKSNMAGLPDGDIELVTLYKMKPTLGIAIEGGANTKQPMPRIISITEGGSAHESGGLKVGHILLEVNGRSLRGLEHQQCAKIIAEAFKDKKTGHMELLVLDPNAINIRF